MLIRLCPIHCFLLSRLNLIISWWFRTFTVNIWWVFLVSRLTHIVRPWGPLNFSMSSPTACPRRANVPNYRRNCTVFTCARNYQLLSTMDLSTYILAEFLWTVLLFEWRKKNDEVSWNLTRFESFQCADSLSTWFLHEMLTDFSLMTQMTLHSRLIYRQLLCWKPHSWIWTVSIDLQWHYYQLSPNIASQLGNEHCFVKHCWDICEQNNTVNSIRVNDWTVECARSLIVMELFVLNRIPKRPFVSTLIGEQ